MKQKHLVLLLIIVVATLLLSGCGVPQSGVDVVSTPPEGWWQTLIVWPLAKALIALNDFLANVNLPYSWGFAIILFTLIIKLATFPLTITQLRGMQAQKELQPRLQELQKKYGKDRERLSREQMKLYREHGVNPLSGCLPLLIQMPILFGLYSALVALGTRLENAAFFWIPSLGFPHYTEGLNWLRDAFVAGDYGTLAAYLVLPILLMASQFVIQRMTTSATPSTGSDGQAGMMQQMSTVMTLMFGFFTLQVPAGLSLYWVTSNLLQLVQQYAVTELDFQKPKTAALAGATVDGTARLVEDTSRNNHKGDSVDEEEMAVATSTTRPRRSRRRRQKRRK